MRVQATTLYLSMLSLFVAADDLFNKGSILRSYNSRQYKQNAMSMYERRPPADAPIEYLKTPNFDVMLLSEDNSDPTWRKYSELFQPKELQNAHQIEVNYGGHDGFSSPFISLDRSELESVLAVLGSKKHIIVLHPRDCKPDSTTRESSLDEFENTFLPKLLQQLQRANVGSEVVDPVVQRILAMLDKDEQKMIDDLRQTFEGYPSQIPEEVNNYNTPPRRKPSVAYNQYRKSRTQKKKNLLVNDPCNEGYVFLVQNQKNQMDPSSLNDLLLRVLKVVTESA